MRTLLLLLFTTMSVLIYGQCYDNSIRRGRELYDQGKYTDAKRIFVAAKGCPDLPITNELNTWIGKCDSKLNEASAQREREASAQREREASAQREREASAQRKAEAERNMIPIRITGIEFGNTDGEGNLIGGYGQPLCSETLKYLKSRITYDNLVKDGRAIKLSTKIINPDGSVHRGTNSPEGYSFNDDIKTYGNYNTSNKSALSGFGTTNGGSYVAGTYYYEIWYEGNRLYSKSFNVVLGGNSTSNTDLTITVKGVNFKMIFVKGGTFQMGDTFGGGESCEKPVHSVTLSDYWIGETEVTQALWQAVMGSNPSYLKGSNLPIDAISWNDCQEFIKKLNAATGKKFRLLTEAEWEYAARGGNKSKGYKYSGSNTVGDVAWYSSNSDGKAHNVKTKLANELGIYDMSGNVWEWCQDWYSSYSSNAQTNPTGATSGSSRVLRGGGWNYIEFGCRVPFRDSSIPDNRFSNGGVRVALVQ